MNCGFPDLQLLVAPLLACDTAKVLAALTEHEPLNRKPPETSVNSEDLLGTLFSSGRILQVLPSDTSASRRFAMGCNRCDFKPDSLELWSVTLWLYIAVLHSGKLTRRTARYTACNPAVRLAWS